jgi:asparagine synthase (glutamine-hydrolysing)
MFAGVRKLPAGCYLTCGRSGEVAVKCYWDAFNADGYAGDLVCEEDIVNQVRDLLSKSISKRAIADVPTGVFLSGGLDSSAIVGLLAPQVEKPLNTFSIGIGDLEGYNELEFARQVAGHFRTNHREILIGQKELQEYLPSFVHSQDEPLADPVCVPLFYLSKLARESGVVVVQVGEGSDEQFLGYDSRISFLRRYQATWARLLKFPRVALAGMHIGAAAVHAISGRGGRWKQQLAKAARGDELFFGSVGFDEDYAKRALLNSNTNVAGFCSQRVVRDILTPLRAAWPRRDISTEISYLDLKVRLAELLLMRIDKVTMSVGVEAREPFLDYRLVELLMALPQSMKLKNQQPKYLLKRAMRGIVPENIISRPKQAFAAPVNVWLRSGLAPYARNLVERSRLRERNLFNYNHISELFDQHIAGTADFGVQLWILMNLSAWYDHWIAGCCPAN